MNEFDRSEGFGRGGGSGRLDASRFDGASFPTPRTDEVRHVTLEALLERVDEALDAIASLDQLEAEMYGALRTGDAEPPASLG